MPERIVDALEVIEVQIEHGQPFAAPDALERFFEPLEEQRAIGQAGQGVVMRRVRDLLKDAALLNDDRQLVGDLAEDRLMQIAVGIDVAAGEEQEPDGPLVDDQWARQAGAASLGDDPAGEVGFGLVPEISLEIVDDPRLIRLQN